jgi:WhiB family redox-sensing transcriptional regulator
MKLDDSWRLRAACRGIIETELFYASKKTRELKEICSRCPVQPDCLDYALLTEQYGIWGGMSEAERKKRYPWYIREAMREDYEN